MLKKRTNISKTQMEINCIPLSSLKMCLLFSQLVSVSGIPHLLGTDSPIIQLALGYCIIKTWLLSKNQRIARYMNDINVFNETLPTSKLASSIFVYQWNYRKWKENYTCHKTKYEFYTGIKQSVGKVIVIQSCWQTESEFCPNWVFAFQWRKSCSHNS